LEKFGCCPLPNLRHPQVWEDGHIQLEVTRKDGSSCHEGQINQLVAEEGELITIGKRESTNLGSDKFSLFLFDKLFQS